MASASGDPSTAGHSPVAMPSASTCTPSETATAPTALPVASADRYFDRSESGPQEVSIAANVTVGKNGPGHSSRPITSSTITSSASPNPDPPYCSSVARPCHPKFSAADQMSDG